MANIRRTIEFKKNKPFTVTEVADGLIFQYGTKVVTQLSLEESKELGMFLVGNSLPLGIGLPPKKETPQPLKVKGIPLEERIAEAKGMKGPELLDLDARPLKSIAPVGPETTSLV